MNTNNNGLLNLTTKKNTISNHININNFQQDHVNFYLSASNIRKNMLYRITDLFVPVQTVILTKNKLNFLSNILVFF